MKFTVIMKETYDRKTEKKRKDRPSDKKKVKIYIERERKKDIDEKCCA